MSKQVENLLKTSKARAGFRSLSLKTWHLKGCSKHVQSYEYELCIWVLFNPYFYIYTNAYCL